jgi:multisubunit Na+/H+ antiporter MnhF subunit
MTSTLTDKPDSEAIRNRAHAESLRDELCVHIFTVSAGLVGVCLTVVGLFRVISRLKDLNSIADNILAIDALAFLASCLMAYLALRTAHRPRRERLERMADGIFLAGLALMVVVCGLVAYELI